MAEMAMVASRKSRLRQWAAQGKKPAKRALFLSEHSSMFLSSIQVGITLIGILLGIFTGSTVMERLNVFLSQAYYLIPYSGIISFLLVTVMITLALILFGELIPKKIALSQPEKLALKIAKPMTYFSWMIKPVIALLSKTTDGFLRLIRIQNRCTEILNEEEIRSIMLEGKQSGVFNETEFRIMERALRLGDQNIQSMMVPRRRMFWINVLENDTKIMNLVLQSSVSHFPLCEGNLDHILGIVQTKDLLQQWMYEKKLNLKSIAREAVFVYEKMGALEVLELFQKENAKIALVIDEYGVIQGIVSFFDYLQVLVGKPILWADGAGMEVKKLDTSTYEIDGMMRMDQLLELFSLPLEKDCLISSATVSGFIMDRLGRIPQKGDSIHWNNLLIYVKDMHHYRIHRLVVRYEKDLEENHEKQN